MNWGWIRNFATVMSGRVGLLALWFGAQIVIFRVLGKSEAGLFTLCLAFIKMVSSCLGDAMDLSVIRRVPLLLKTDWPGAIEALRATFFLRVCAGLLIGAMLLPCSWWIAVHYLDVPGRPELVWLALAGVMGELLFRSSMTFLQANEAFVRLTILESTLQIGRVVAILTMVGLGLLSATSALAAYTGVSFMVFLVSALLLLPKGFFRLRMPERAVMGDALQYIKWSLLSMVLAALAERVDLFLIGVFHTSAEVGIYGAAMLLALLPDLVGSGLAILFQPKIAGLHASGGFPAYQRRYLCWSAPLALLAGLFALLVVPVIIPLVLGQEYAGVIDVFRILVVGYLFYLAIAPLPSALIALVAPRQLAVLTGTQFVVAMVAGWLLIPKFGALGAACMAACIRALIGVALMVLASRVSRGAVHAAERASWPAAAALDTTAGLET